MRFLVLMEFLRIIKTQQNRQSKKTEATAARKEGDLIFGQNKVVKLNFICEWTKNSLQNKQNKIKINLQK